MSVLVPFRVPFTLVNVGGEKSVVFVDERTCQSPLGYARNVPNAGSPVLFDRN